MLYKNRDKFSNLSIKIGMAFSRLKISPNAWTALTLAPAIAAAFFIIKEEFLAASLFFFLASFLDLVDGSVARVTGRVTKKGAYLDTIMDRYVEGIIIISLFFAALPNYIFNTGLWLMLFLFGSSMTTYAKAAAKEKLDAEIKGGVAERAERLVILFIGLLAGSLDKTYLTYSIVLLAVVSNFTALQRIYIAIKQK